MDRVELTKDDITALLDWRDAHKEEVRSMPAPLKAVEIVFKHNDYRIKGVRDEDKLTLHLSHGYESLGHVEMEIDPVRGLVLRKGKLKCDEDGFRSVLTVYSSVMALMAYGGAEYDEERIPKQSKAQRKAGKKPALSRKPRTTYILHRKNGAVYAAPRGSHASPHGIFTVRGHFRHYKSGKVVWVAEYKKGVGRKKRKTYKMGGNRDER